MNAARRAALSKLIDRVEAAKTKYEEFIAESELESIKEDLEALRDEEQEYFDAMPESFQNGEKGEVATEAVSQMEEAIDSLDTTINDAPDFDSMVSAIDNSRGQ